MSDHKVDNVDPELVDLLQQNETGYEHQKQRSRKVFKPSLSRFTTPILLVGNVVLLVLCVGLGLLLERSYADHKSYDPTVAIYCELHIFQMNDMPPNALNSAWKL